VANRVMAVTSVSAMQENRVGFMDSSIELVQ
jgi:hypothetical protein